MKDRRAELKEYRARARKNGMCSSCATRPVHKIFRNGWSKVFSKCKICLRRAAWFQAEHREKQK